MSFTRFLEAISKMSEEKQESLISEYIEVFDRMVKRRQELIDAFPTRPGNVLQRQPAACYDDGSFLVMWYEQELILKTQ